MLELPGYYLFHLKHIDGIAKGKISTNLALDQGQWTHFKMSCVDYNNEYDSVLLKYCEGLHVRWCQHARAPRPCARVHAHVRVHARARACALTYMQGALHIHVSMPRLV